jgi:hemerythrin-like domain-containing protein
MSTAASRVVPSITTMIRVDHSHVLALFHRYKADTSASKKRALVQNACLALQIHAQLEEEIFYPALRSVMGGDEVLEKSEPEHQQMRQLIGELQDLTSRDTSSTTATYDEQFYDLMRLVIHHVADEETKLLPAAERLLADRLGQLGMEMTRRRVELMKPHAAQFAANTVRSFPGAAAGGALLLTAGVLALGALALGRQKGVRGTGDWRPKAQWRPNTRM